MTKRIRSTKRQTASCSHHVSNVESALEQVERQPFHPREFRGYALDCAARLEAACPHFLLRLLFASTLARNAFFAVAAELDLIRPEAFLAQIERHAPAVFAENNHLDPTAQIARALIQLPPRKVLETLYGECPAGLPGLLSRIGHAPLDDPKAYRIAFELFAQPEKSQRAKALSQLPGLVRAEHIVMAAELDDVLCHRAVLERAKAEEVASLNAFVKMLPALCDASLSDIRDSLDQLSSPVRGVEIGAWAQSWMKRQVRLLVPLAIADDDPDLKVCIGSEQSSLGRRHRNCAANLLASTFLGQRVLVEWIRTGQDAVIELVLVKTGGEYRWQCEQVVSPRNRRVKHHIAMAIRQRLDEIGVLYRTSPMAADQHGVQVLLDHYGNLTFADRPAAADSGENDADIERLLDELQVELQQPEAA